MSDNIIRFPIVENDGPPTYTVHIWVSANRLDWSVDADTLIDTDDLAADMASLALYLRPPKKTFIERLLALFTGD